MSIYKKLVRAQIPNMIKNNGKTPTTLEEINTIRKKKAEERGGFKNRVFLIEVTDN
ncbi:hypothetical protein [Bacillus paramycoides]|uniref:hypothetical protein n=1 Tax=Bacillus paramycoides TaxID=2026194 RepID=UPI002E1BE4A9|nr:hypothetical protein [Bacillus paramycoides]